MHIYASAYVYTCVKLFFKILLPATTGQHYNQNPDKCHPVCSYPLVFLSNKSYLKHSQLFLFDMSGLHYFLIFLKIKGLLQMLTLNILMGIVIICQKNI